MAVRRLKDADRVAGGVVDEGLSTARSTDYVVAKPEARGAEALDLGVDVVDDEVDVVPASWSGLRPSGIGRPAELSGPASSSRRLPLIAARSRRAQEAPDRVL
jgi:hypothetical protein